MNNYYMTQKILYPSDNITTVTLSNAYAVSIQATPGTKFYFNNSTNARIIMGPSGIYQLNFFKPILTSISFSEIINNGLPIIIDIIQESER